MHLIVLVCTCLKYQSFKRKTKLTLQFMRVNALHVAKKVTSWEIMLLPVFEVETELPGMTYFVM